MTDAIIISGASGSGKTTFSHWLAPRVGARVLNAGDIVLHTVLARDLTPVSRADAGRLFIKHMGELALGPLILQRLRPSELVIIDGLRLPFAKQLLQSRLGQLLHLHLDVSRELLQRRLVSRDGSNSICEPAESFLPYLKKHADLVISNFEVEQTPPSCENAESNFLLPSSGLLDVWSSYRKAQDGILNSPRRNFDQLSPVFLSTTAR